MSPPKPGQEVMAKWGHVDLNKPVYQLWTTDFKHIRPQGVENRASRPLSRTQATRRLVSSLMGDRKRILAVVCFSFCSINISDFLGGTEPQEALGEYQLFLTSHRRHVG